VTYGYFPECEVSRGDIFRDIGLNTSPASGPEKIPTYKKATVLVVNRNCDISKPVSTANSVLVVRVRPLARETERFQAAIRENSVVSAFYLPSDGAFLQESYADWHSLQQVSKALLYATRLPGGNYLCTLDPIMRKACLGSLSVFLFKDDDHAEQDEQISFGMATQQTETS